MKFKYSSNSPLTCTKWLFKPCEMKLKLDLTRVSISPKYALDYQSCQSLCLAFANDQANFTVYSIHTLMLRPGHNLQLTQ